MMNHLDRQVMGILLEAIRLDLDLTDFELGLISGLAFAVVFAVATIPAALWSAYGSRRNLIALSAIVWSLMTMFGSMATGFWHLAIARAGIALGEAGSGPASHSLLSDMAGDRRRTGSLALFTAGAALGTALAIFAGGLLGQMFGWRAALLAVGVPGLVLGMALLLVREPARAYAHPASAREALRPAVLLTTVREIAAARPALLALLAAMLHYIVLNGGIAWYPAFLIRVHGFTPLQAGTVLALGGLAGVAGTIYSGRLIDRVGTARPGLRAWIPAAAIALTTPFDMIMLLADDPRIVIAAFFVPVSVSAIMVAPTAAILHEAVAPPRRAMASAILLGAGSALVGTGLGPSAVGVMSHFAFGGGTADSLRYALVALQLFGLSAALVYYLAGRSLAVAPSAG